MTWHESSASSGCQGRAPWAWVTSLALLAALLRPCNGIVKMVDESMDERVLPLEYDFGLDTGATVTIDLSTSRPVNDTYLLVFTHSQWVLRRQALEDYVSLDTFMVSCWRGSLSDRLSASFTVREEMGGRNRYTVVLMTAMVGSPFGVKGMLSLVNPGGKQLSLQETSVPPALLFASCFFLAACVAELVVLLRAHRRGDPGAQRARSFHRLMVLVLLLRGTALLVGWADYRQVESSGRDSPMSDVAWQLLVKVQTIAELMMFLLISLGWKIVRDELDVTEIRFAGSISLISFYLGVGQIACTTQSTCNGYALSRYILHSLCYLVVIVAMNFNLQKVTMAIQEAPANEENGKLYRKLHAYQLFRWVFLVFIIAPTVELFLKVTIVPWDEQWLFVMIQEARTWVIYTLIIMAFRPERPLLRVFELTQDVGSDHEDETVA